eukprot:357627-Chlamydomonas_euryale.AAC.3
MEWNPSQQLTSRKSAVRTTMLQCNAFAFASVKAKLEMQMFAICGMTQLTVAGNFERAAPYRHLWLDQYRSRQHFSLDVTP